MASTVKTAILEKAQYTSSDDQLILQNERNTLLNQNSKIRQYSSDSGDDELIKDVGSDDKMTKCFNFLLSLTLEPFMFVFMFAYFARSVCVTNLIMEKVCHFRLNHSQEICQNLSSDITIKDEVERISNDIGMYNTLIMMGPGAITMLFLGPWSDKYGRKPPLILAMIGLFLDDGILLLNAIYKEAPVELMLVGSVPSGITGGFIGVMTLINSMASEVTTKRARTFKYALVELSFGLGICLGILVGGLLYDSKYSYYSAFGVTVVGHAVCIPWILFVIKETRGLDVKVGWLSKAKDLFTCKNFTEGFKACIKKRENHGRCQIWLLLGSMCAIIVTYEAFAGIAYLYAFHIYGWSVSDYSKVSTIFTTTSLAVSVLCVPLLIRYFKMGDAGLGFIGTLSMLGKNVFFGFAQHHTWIYYIGGAAGCCTGLALLAIRARLSKLVEEDELVKVFIFLSACESLVPLAGKVAITKIYNASLDFFPGLAYLSGAALLIVPLVTFWWISRLKNDGYSLLKNSRIQEP